MTPQELIDLSDQLFAKRDRLLPLHQELAENFYPERADFTVTRHLGDDFADHLETSFPVQVRRDLGNTFSSMLRPPDQPWFHLRSAREDAEDKRGLEWLEAKTGVIRRAIGDKAAQFKRATKETDQDYATFGQAVISVELTVDPVSGQTLLFRNWHTRDCAWAEAENGKIDTVHRKWKPTVRGLMRQFRNVHPNVRDAWEKDDKFTEINCRHIVMPSEDHEIDGKRVRQPFVSIHIDVDNQHIMRETGAWRLGYVIPRWQTVSGSPYAYSPAAIVALPDARLIQAMTLTLLEAGEWAVSPPMLATEDALRSDLALFSRGVSYVSEEFADRKHDAVRPITTNNNGLPFGLEMSDRVADMINRAFFLNRLTLPPLGGPEMTAFEVGQRVQEFVRQAMPIFEPIEDEYNDPLLEETFDILLRNGALGPVEDIPPQLRGTDTQFRFESPLREASERAKAQVFLEGGQLLRQAAELDPTVVVHLDAHRALRESLQGIGVPSKWMTDEEVAAQEIQRLQEQQQLVQAGGAVQAGAEVAKSVGEAGQALAAAE